MSLRDKPLAWSTEEQYQKVVALSSGGGGPESEEDPVTALLMQTAARVLRSNEEALRRAAEEPCLVPPPPVETSNTDNAMSQPISISSTEPASRQASPARRKRVPTPPPPQPKKSQKTKAAAKPQKKKAAAKKPSAKKPAKRRTPTPEPLLEDQREAMESEIFAKFEDVSPEVEERLMEILGSAKVDISDLSPERLRRVHSILCQESSASKSSRSTEDSEESSEGSRSSTDSKGFNKWLDFLKSSRESTDYSYGLVKAARDAFVAAAKLIQRPAQLCTGDCYKKFKAYMDEVTSHGRAPKYPVAVQAICVHLAELEKAGPFQDKQMAKACEKYLASK